MSKPSREAYDVIIIGAGIGGLVCGCYLAKAGMKVLICEQHHKPGGYCTSFKRGPFTFDAGPHCFGSYREGGIMRKILQDLLIEKDLKIIRNDPSDVICTPDFRIEFRRNDKETISNIQESFPRERDNIPQFFDVLRSSDPRSFGQLRNLTFKSLLDQFFSDGKLKGLLSFPFFGICGLPSYLVSAFVGAKLYSEFLLDGGYYPEGGMQKLSDALAEKFKIFGGDLKLSCLVTSIEVKNNNVDGVRTETDQYLQSNYVVSDCDARQTFMKLLDRTIVNNNYLLKIKNMKQSLSNFIIYLGVDKAHQLPIKPGAFCFYFSHYDLRNIYNNALKGNIGQNGGFALKMANDRSTINAVFLASYMSKKYWQDNKFSCMDRLIETIENIAIPNISSYIVHREAATPLTLQQYTLNYKGASFGWENTVSQFALAELRKPTFVKNLYLTGHWSTLGIGISGTAYVGSDTANIILRRAKLQAVAYG